jgi:hypothetical protein
LVLFVLISIYQCIQEGGPGLDFGLFCRLKPGRQTHDEQSTKKLVLNISKQFFH